MLVLTRRQGESIRIGNDIIVTVIEVRGGQVRIGVQAPRAIQVHRSEVYEQVSRENEAAVASAAEAASVLRQTQRASLKRDGPTKSESSRPDPS